MAANSAVVIVHPDRVMGPINRRIFGQYTEETLTSFDGGVSSQLLFNRKFEMPEPRDAQNFLFKGTSEGWDPIALDTGVTLVLDRDVYYSPSQSQRISYAGGETPAGIQQRGLCYVLPQFLTSQHIDDPFRFLPGERYKVRLAIKNQDLSGAVHVALRAAHGGDGVAGAHVRRRAADRAVHAPWGNSGGQFARTRVGHALPAVAIRQVFRPSFLRAPGIYRDVAMDRSASPVVRYSANESHVAGLLQPSDQAGTAEILRFDRRDARSIGIAVPENERTSTPQRRIRPFRMIEGPIPVDLLAPQYLRFFVERPKS